MPPGETCRTCNYKVRTAHEPATEKEMKGLIQKAANHAGVAAARLTGLVPDEKGHMAMFEYYEQTPTDGSFDNAEVIG